MGYTDGADGTRIFYETMGDGPITLLCNDGIGCDGFAWKYIQRDFASHYRIVHWHYRGHGRSGLPGDPLRVGFDDISDDLAAVLRANNTQRAVFLGHSMGVQVALEYHRRHPENVQGLVLICGSHGLPLDTFHDNKILKVILPAWIAAANAAPALMNATWRNLAGGELAYQIATRMEVNGKLVRREDFEPYFKHLAAMDPRLFLSMLKEASEHSAWDHLPDIKVPTLIIAGTRDTFTPYRLSEEMHARIPGSELCTIPGGTHIALLEQPELVALRLEKFLAAIARRPEPTLRLA